MKKIMLITMIFALLLTACAGKTTPSKGAAIQQTAETLQKDTPQQMSTEEYKSFLKKIDPKISGTLQIIDQSIMQYKQQIITKQDFVSGLKEALQKMKSAENTFMNAIPPKKLKEGHSILTQGVSMLKQGIQTMKKAVEQENDGTYKQSVQQFSSGIQTIQQGNEELRRNL